MSSELEPGCVYAIYSRRKEIKKFIFSKYNNPENSQIIIPVGSLITFLGVCIHPEIQQNFSKFLYKEMLIGCKGELKVDSINTFMKKMT